MTLEFHNTVNLKGDELKKADDRAMSQSEWIKQFFNAYAHQPMGGSAVKRAYDKSHNKTILITSVRRAISNLSKGNNAWLVDTGLTVPTDNDGKEKLYQRNVPQDSPPPLGVIVEDTSYSLFGDTVNKRDDEGLQ